MVARPDAARRADHAAGHGRHRPPPRQAAATLGARARRRPSGGSTFRSRCRAWRRRRCWSSSPRSASSSRRRSSAAARETMITQLIITQVQELLNWGFAGALSVLLLVAALLIFYPLRPAARPLDAGRRERSRAAAAADAHRRMPAQSAPGSRPARSRLRPVAIACEGCPPARRPPGARPAARVLLDRRHAARSPSWCCRRCFVVPVSFTASEVPRLSARGLLPAAGTQSYLGSPLWTEATRALLRRRASSPAAARHAARRAGRLRAGPRSQAPARPRLLALILSPLIIPRIVIAVALFYLYARIGLVGTSLGLVLGHTVLAVPFVVDHR